MRFYAAFLAVLAVVSADVFLDEKFSDGKFIKIITKQTMFFTYLLIIFCH